MRLYYFTSLSSNWIILVNFLWDNHNINIYWKHEDSTTKVKC